MDAEGDGDVMRMSISDENMDLRAMVVLGFQNQGFQNQGFPDQSQHNFLRFPDQSQHNFLGFPDQSSRNPLGFPDQSSRNPLGFPDQSQHNFLGFPDQSFPERAFTFLRHADEVDEEEEGDEFWADVDGGQSVPISGDVVPASEIYHIIRTFLRSVQGVPVIGVDWLNVCHGYPDRNPRLLDECVERLVRQHGENLLVFLVIRNTFPRTIGRMQRNRFLRRHCIIFNVSARHASGNLLTQAELTPLAESRGINVRTDMGSHALVGHDDYVLLWMRFYFGIEIISSDLFRDEVMLATVFRDILFRVEIIDTRSGARWDHMTMFERNVSI